MPSDPLTGLLSDSDQTLVTEYLGRQVPVSERGQASLPVGGAPVTGGAGPVAPGGTGVSTAPVGATPGGPPKAPGKPSDVPGLAKLGVGVAEKLQKLFGGPTPATVPSSELLGDAPPGPPVYDVVSRGTAPAPNVPPDVGAFAETGAESGAAGAEAAPAEAAAPAAEGAGFSLGGAVGPALAAVGAGLDIYGRSKGRMPAGQQAGEAAVEAAGVAAAPFTLGLSAIAAPLVNMAIEEIASAGANYAPTRRKAYSQLTQGLQGGFAPSLQEAVGKGPEAVQKLLTPENLKEFGLEVQRDPQTGEYTVGLSSAGHPYIKYTDALNAQTQLSQAVNQALQVSRAFQLAQPPAEAPAAAPAPAPAPAPPSTPAGGGPLGLAEIGLEVGQ